MRLCQLDSRGDWVGGKVLTSDRRLRLGAMVVGVSGAFRDAGGVGFVKDYGLTASQIHNRQIDQRGSLIEQ